MARVRRVGGDGRRRERPRRPDALAQQRPGGAQPVRRNRGTLNEADLRLAQALADVATIVLIQDRAAADKEAVNVQLQNALDSRVVLEQAKGVLADSGDLDMSAAYAALRQYARDHNIKLAQLAVAVVSRALPAGIVLEHART